MVDKAVQLVIQQIEEPGSEVQNAIVAGQLIIRGSARLPECWRTADAS